MKVVALVHYYVPYYMAGSETMLHAMLSSLAQRGHQVQVVVTSHERGPHSYTHQGIGVRRADRQGVVRVMDELAPDVIVSHHQEAPHAAHYARTRRGVGQAKVVLLFHNTFPASVQVARRWKPDLAVFNTHWVREHYIRSRAVRSGGERTLVVHPPIDGDAHRTTPGEHVTLVNLNKDKGGLIFYDLAERMPDVPFLAVVGGHGQQIIRTDLPNVTVQEHTPDPRRHIWARTRVLLMPSVYESYGMVSIEAAHSGIPTVANPTPGLREALGEAGIWAPREHRQAWEQQIRRLLQDKIWKVASQRTRRRAAELDPDPELHAWADAVENLAVYPEKGEKVNANRVDQVSPFRYRR